MAACRSQLLGLVLSLCLSGLRADDATTCWVPSVEEGEATNITCNFAEDVRLTNRNIKIQRQPLTVSSDGQEVVEDVLFCYWETKEKLKCEPREGDGYQLLETPTNKAVLHIVTATKFHVGKYSCQTLPSTSQDIRPCFFVLKGTSNIAAVYNRVKELSDELVETRETLTGTVKLQGALLIVILVLLLLAVVAGVLFVFRERMHNFIEKRKSSGKNVRQSEKGDEECIEEGLPLMSTEFGTPMTSPATKGLTVNKSRATERSEEAGTADRLGGSEGKAEKETEVPSSSKDIPDSGAAKPNNQKEKEKSSGLFGISRSKKKGDQDKPENPALDTASGHKDSAKPPAPKPPLQGNPPAPRTEARAVADSPNPRTEADSSPRADIVTPQRPQQPQETAGPHGSNSPGAPTGAQGGEQARSKKICLVM